MSQLLTSFAQLEEHLLTRGQTLASCGLPVDAANTVHYPLRLSTYYADLIDWSDPHDPLRCIAIPTAEESITESYELTDPIGDHAHEAVPGLIHRYPDRALLLLTTHCRIHCRFCFRREVVGKGRPFNLEAIRAYLEKHPEVKELIFSGGDPFTFPPVFLQQMIDRLTTLPHIQRVRFHTRIPAVDPDSLTNEFFATLKAIPQRVIVVIHCDHSREVTLSLTKVAERLRNAGCLVLSQSVLLKGVNDSTSVLSELFTKLVEAGVKPYYLHHPDKVVNTSHFRISIVRGRELFQSLRRMISPTCLPEYVLDLPGGFGKVPVMWLKQLDEKTYQATTFEGKEVLYEDPGEKI